MNGVVRTEVVTKSQSYKGCVAGSPKPPVWRKTGQGEVEEGRDGSRVPADRPIGGGGGMNGGVDPSVKQLSERVCV